MEKRRFPPKNYTVGWVSALPLELQAARAMLDEEHQEPSREPHETNIYCLGRIAKHNVVIVCLPAGRYGSNSAAAGVAQMIAKFRSIKFGFLVGIAGGVPSDEADVRLGDVVISQPRGQYGGIVQYDLGKIEAGGKSHRTGYLSPPPTILLNAVAQIQSLGRDQGNHIVNRLPLTKGIQNPKYDTLYESTYDHVGGATCLDCDPTKVTNRKDRPEEIRVHYGIIASGNQVVKDGVTRDRLSQELDGVLCFEMEAAGVVNTLPCLVIRGICDYCDSHKNKEWQRYAAMAAALCTKDFFDIIPAAEASEVAEDSEARARSEAIFVTDPLIDRANLITAKGAKVDGTCEWIRENKSYNDWLDPHGEPFLWICGGPGKGKTILSIYLTEEVEKFTKSCEGGGDLVFYFCGHEDEKRNGATAVLRGLIYQVLKKKPWLFRHARRFFDAQKKAGYTLSSPQALWTIFRDIVEDPELDMVFCIIDGLDECDDESAKFLGAKISQLFIHNKSKPFPFRFRLAVVSREIHVLKGSTTIQLDPDFDEQVNNDIQRFVLYRVHELYKVDGFTPELAAHVEKILLQRSEGTFLWVGFVMNELLQKTTCTELLETLETLPKGLPAIYSRILLRIGQRKRHVCALILLWVALAFRPLTIYELADVINIHISTKLNREQAILDQLALCKPLVRIQDGEIGLIHESVRDYLLRDNYDENPILEAFRIKPEEGHFRIVQTCLDFIEKSNCRTRIVEPQTPAADKDEGEESKNTSKEGEDGEDENEGEEYEVVDDAAILKYAINSWPRHTRYAGQYGHAIFDLSRPIFQQDSRGISKWFTSFESNRGRMIPHRDSTLHVASSLGLTAWIRKLIAQKRWDFLKIRYLNKKIWNGRTPLHESAAGGHEAATQVLLENGADANAKSNNGDTPLSAAASGGHDSVMRLLLRHGAEIDTPDSIGNTALVDACILKKSKMARLLISHGADTNPGCHQNPLHEAAAGGADDIVELLIKHGAELEARNAMGVTPLGFAAFHGQIRTARKLLSLGVDPTCPDDRGASLMHSAITHGFEGIVPTLLEYGANIDRPDNYGYTPLTRAVLKGDVRTVRLLLDHGANFHVSIHPATVAELAALFWHDDPEVMQALREIGLPNLTSLLVVSVVELVVSVILHVIFFFAKILLIAQNK